MARRCPLSSKSRIPLARKRFILNPKSDSSSSQSGTDGQGSSRSSSSQTSSGGEEKPLQITETEILKILTHGELREQGLLPYSSNHSFLITATHDGVSLPGVYKPRKG